MALARLKTWIAGEVLTASDLNGEFNNIINNLSVALSSQFADGTVSLPSIAFINDTDSGWYRFGANQVGWVVGGVEVLRASPYTSGVNFLLVAPGQAGQGAVLVATGSDTNVPLWLIPKGTGYVRVPGGASINTRFYPGLGVGNAEEGVLSLTAGTLDLIAGGRRVLQASTYAQATNYLRITPSQSGTPVIIDVAGADANIGLQVQSLGTGAIDLFAGGARVLQASPYTSAVNALRVSSSQAGQPVIIDAMGSDTNIPLLLRGKATGYVTASNFVLENFTATQSPTITGRMYWQTAEGGVHISAGTLMGRVPVLTNTQAGDIVVATNSGNVSGATTFGALRVGSPYAFLSLNTSGTPLYRDLIAGANIGITHAAGSATITGTAGGSSPFSASFTSTTLFHSNTASQFRVAHGLGAMPSLIQARLKAIVPEAKWNIGDEIEMTGSVSPAVNVDKGVSVGASTATVFVSYTADLQIINRDIAAGAVGLTDGNWRWIVRAWL